MAVAIGAPLGALLATFAGWRGTFFAIAAFGALAGLVLAWRLPRGMTGTRLSLQARLGAALRPGVLPVLATTLLALTGAFTVFSYIAPLAMQGAGLGEIALPALLLAFGVGAVAGNIAGGQLADRIGATRTVGGSLALLTGIMALLSAVPALPPALAVPLLFALMVLWGLIGWALPPAQASRIVKLAPDAAPIVLSLNA